VLFLKEILIYNPISAHTGQINSHSAMFIDHRLTFTVRWVQ